MKAVSCRPLRGPCSAFRASCRASTKMEQLPRVDANEDPYLALRTMLGVALLFALAEPLGMTQPMLPIAIGMSLLSGQRGALTPRSFAGPVMLPVIAIIFS